MPRLTEQKRALYDTLRSHVGLGGGRTLLLSSPTEWPQLYSIIRGDEAARVRIYIWRLTHDIARDDYKFQLTNVENNQFAFTSDSETVVLGYYEDMRLYVAADAEQRRERFGESPAIQARKAHLDLANRDGFAAYEKAGTREIALVVRYDFLATYLLNVRTVHAIGQLPDGVQQLERVAETHGRVELRQRDTRVVTFTQSVRASDFRRRVLIAYEHQCAVCLVQLRLVEAAHIIPVDAEQGSDETCNGLALCALHHLAYDNGFLGVLPDYRVVTNETAERELHSLLLVRGLREFKESARASIVVPDKHDDQPRPEYLLRGLEQRGWENPERL